MTHLSPNATVGVGVRGVVREGRDEGLGWNRREMDNIGM